MKYLILVADGISDRPVRALGGKTPLEVSKHPMMDRIARNGRCGLVKTLFEGLPYDSGVANMSLMGYDVKNYPGRGALEAGNMGVTLSEGDIAYRCNLVSVKDGLMHDFTAGHISNQEAHEIINDLSKKFAEDGVEFYPGVSYRHLLVLRKNYSTKVDCKLPHEIMGNPVEPNMPKAMEADGEQTAKLLGKLMLESIKFLKNHPVNKKRVSEGKNPASMIWLWGGGKKPNLEKFKDKFGLDGALISAVDLLKGIARYIGLEVIEVEGATGYIDTNYEGKAQAALDAFKTKDLVYLHIEATDESGHEGSIEHKVQAIEDIDSRVLAKIMEDLEEPYTIAVTSDHATPIEVRNHVDDLVPYAVYKSGVKVDETQKYTEREIKENASLPQVSGKDFLKQIIEL
ncbi:MAG TPA: cofactor-independent phosphoglycerate mutase [Candidatus Altiarchaeales archaeon]|nr:cofactor-independent phosphoglycerate mutase [Candidatus Altiarchaeales archaeon]